MSCRLAIDALTPEAFAPFGEVISPDAARRVFPINAGNTQRFHDLADVECLGDGGRIGISLFRARPRDLPFEVTMLERHPLGSQAFVPLSQAPYLVVVAESPDAMPRAFLARDGQGVNYRRGTWHHPLLALDAVSDFLVVDRIGAGHNCDEVTLPQAWLLEPPH
ncbi:ureidoglycolate lyase [Xanthomonadaceae bacterium JHOS43]|nr:ureidoglycolate lyase [Xanthomonadaceae bacterium JHOS43]